MSPNYSHEIPYIPALRHVIIQSHHNMCTRIAHDQNLYNLVNVTKQHHMHV